MITLCIAMASVGLIVNAITLKNAHNRGTILFIGDSNMVQGAGQIVNYMNWAGDNQNNGYVPVFITRKGSGIRTADCLNQSSCTTWDFWKIKIEETLPDVKPDIVVINLGTNDARLIGTAGTLGYTGYAAKIDWMMQRFSPTQKVLWSNLPCTLEPADRKTGCQAVNYHLSQALQRWPNLRLANWAAAANLHPEYMITNDAHYTDTGYDAYAKFIEGILDTMRPLPQD